PTSTLGEATIDAAQIEDEKALETVFERAKKAAKTWQDLPAETRAKVLFRAGDYVAARRDDLLEVMGSETGKTLDQGDPEVSEAVDFCRYYANLGLELDNIAGAQHRPVDVTVV